MKRPNARNPWSRWNRRIKVSLAATFTATAFSGCLSSDIAKRFREAYVPGLSEGLSTAVLNPGDWETGLRQAWAALMQGIAATLETRTPPTGSDN